MDTPNTYSLIDMIVKRYTDALDLIEQSPSVAHHGGLQAVDAQRDGREIASGFPALEPQPMEDAAATEATGAAVVAGDLDAVNVGPHAKYCRLCVMWLNGPIQFLLIKTLEKSFQGVNLPCGIKILLKESRVKTEFVY